MVWWLDRDYTAVLGINTIIRFLSPSYAGPVAAQLFVTVKLVHVFGGIYIWEWISTVQFEWEVFTGRRRFRWSFVAYELCRTLCLASITITLIAGFNLLHHFNCEAWFRALLVFSYFSIAFSSLLILLRGFVSFLALIPASCR
ncbi:hypothetical protein EDB85DRAFT_1947641 [Lactarius pseudohatsudake]|nr:hypothetical protein EDB85DRAFT_1947641 [Lactarius pseudohatsudake]